MPEIQVVHDALAHYMSKPGISKDTARDIRELLGRIREVVRYMKEAESTVPEKMRRLA